MYAIPELHRKLGDKEVIRAFVGYLAEHGNPGIKVDYFPDKKIHKSQGPTQPDIDAIAGRFAIEHTSIDTAPDQRRDSAWFMQVVKSLEDEFHCTLPFRLNLTVPYEGIQAGQDWAGITNALRNWVFNDASKLSNDHHIVRNVPGIPFEFHATKKGSSHTGLLFGRFAPNDQTFPVRLRKQLDRKIEKLSPYKNRNKTTIILVESNDIALMNDGIMWDGLRSAYLNGWPQGLDQVWFADTSIPEEMLFTDMTKAVIR